MIALIQRVSAAQVLVRGETLGAINQGILALIGIARDDDAQSAALLLRKILQYRIFADDAGKMNRALVDIAGGLLLVPQFTLLADTQSGLRPSFSQAAAPATAKAVFDDLVQLAKTEYHPVAAGEFGADMQVHLINDGPVTFWLEI